jgi:hypothetical protein
MTWRESGFIVDRTIEAAIGLRPEASVHERESDGRVLNSKIGFLISKL